MEDKLQYSGPPAPVTDADLIKLQIVKALEHLLKQDEVDPDAVSKMIEAMGAHDLLETMVRIDLSLNFTVEMRIQPNYYEESTEEEQIEDLLSNVVHHPEVLTKDVSELVTGVLDLSGTQQIGDVTLEVKRVYDAPVDDTKVITEDVEPSDSEVVVPHTQVEMSYRSSGLPVILDADSDPFNRVLGMEFPLAGRTFKAAFANSHGTVIHLYEKVGKKWRPLCDRRNATGPNGISIQSNRDHRKYCEQCENKYANKVVD